MTDAKNANHAILIITAGNATPIPIDLITIDTVVVIATVIIFGSIGVFVAVGIAIVMVTAIVIVNVSIIVVDVIITMRSIFVIICITIAQDLIQLTPTVSSALH